MTISEKTLNAADGSHSTYRRLLGIDYSSPSEEILSDHVADLLILAHDLELDYIEIADRALRDAIMDLAEREDEVTS